MPSPVPPASMPPSASWWDRELALMDDNVPRPPRPGGVPGPNGLLPTLGIALDWVADANGKLRATVLDVLLESPAQRMGIVNGDVVESWNDDPIESPSDWQNKVDHMRIGKLVVLGVRRHEELRTFWGHIEGVEAKKVNRYGNSTKFGELQPTLGLAVEWMPHSKIQNQQQAVIVSVLPDSPADKAGIQKTDIIEIFDDVLVTDPTVWKNRIESMEIGQLVKLGLRRHDQPWKVPLKAEGRILPQPPHPSSPHRAQ